ncbi:hypothetical protein BU25DRAFT_296699, partial [Macroventuria anomochaeta]
RYLDAAEELGWTSLLFIPYETISRHWIEQTLGKKEWQLWLQLVAKVNPVAIEAFGIGDQWLGSKALAGGSLEGKTCLFMEGGLPQPLQSAEE